MSRLYCRKKSTRMLEVLLKKVHYERIQRSLTPKHGEEIDASNQKLRNEIWDSQEREISRLKPPWVVKDLPWTLITDKRS